jgi:hypothetical protein
MELRQGDRKHLFHSGIGALGTPVEIVPGVGIVGRTLVRAGQYGGALDAQWRQCGLGVLA